MQASVASEVATRVQLKPGDKFNSLVDSIQIQKKLREAAKQELLVYGQ